MSDLYNEIKDDIKEERIYHLWKRYNKAIIGSAVTIVVATAIGTWWSGYHSTVQGKIGDSLFEAHVANKNAKSEEALALYDSVLKDVDSSQGAVDVAALETAVISGDNGDLKTMLSAYEETAVNDAASEEGRQLAVLLYAYNVLGVSSPADAQLSKVEAMLGNIPDNQMVWPYSFKEIEALLAWKQGHIEQTRAILNDLTDMERVPSTLKLRATQILQSLPGEVSAAKKE